MTGKANTAIRELAELLDAIGGMIVQYQETGIEASILGRDWPRHRALLLDILFRQLAVQNECDRAAGWEMNRIDEDCVSAQECAIGVLLKAGLLEEVRRARLFVSRDKREPGYYLNWQAYDRMMKTADFSELAMKIVDAPQIFVSIAGTDVTRSVRSMDIDYQVNTIALALNGDGARFVSKLKPGERVTIRTQHQAEEDVHEGSVELLGFDRIEASDLNVEVVAKFKIHHVLRYSRTDLLGA